MQKFAVSLLNLSDILGAETEALWFDRLIIEDIAASLQPIAQI